MTAPDVSSLEEAADYLRLTERKVRELVNTHKLGAVKVGRELTFPRAALEQFLSENTSAVVPPNAFGLTDRSAARLRATG